MKSCQPPDRRMRDLDREIGFAPPVERKPALGIGCINIIGFVLFAIIIILLFITP